MFLVLFDYAEDESEKEATLRELAYVVRACFHGEGYIEQKRGLFRTRSSFTVTVKDREWKLGRQSGSVHSHELSTHAHAGAGNRVVRARRW